MEQVSLPTPNAKELFFIIRTKPQTGPRLGLSHRKKTNSYGLARGIFP
jgi:hypothetical protein